jgi:hypothetical protein
MKKFKFSALLFAITLTATTQLWSAEPEVVPAPLVSQVSHLSALLSDGYAVGYPEATMVSTIERKKGEPITLAVFTVEGFGGGNNHTQYLAAFNKHVQEDGKIYFEFMDVIAIAGKGWRAILNPNAKVKKQTNADTLFTLNVMTMAEHDAPNFPSIPATIVVQLKNRRLTEVNLK